MRKFLFGLLFVAMDISLAKAWEPLPELLDGSMRLYDFSRENEGELPDSLTLEGAAVIARHGARFLTSEAKVSDVEGSLLKAKAGGSLTPEGEAFLCLLDSIRTLSAGNWGMLTPIGISQEQELGRRMAKDFPALFNPIPFGELPDPDAWMPEYRWDTVPAMISVSSFVPRCVETMNQFSLGILRQYEGIPLNQDCGARYDASVRFFSISKKYLRWRKSGDWKKIYSRFAGKTLPSDPALRLVGEKSGMTPKELRGLSYDIYKVMQGMRAMGMVPTTRWMSVGDYEKCWQCTNMQKYFQYSVSPLSDIPARGAGVLKSEVLDFLSGLKRGEEENSGSGKCRVKGWFGHAETLLPFMAAMDLPGTVYLPEDGNYDDLDNHWSDAELTPLGANILLLLCKSKSSGRYYLQPLLNGRRMGLRPF